MQQNNLANLLQSVCTVQQNKITIEQAQKAKLLLEAKQKEQDTTEQETTTLLADVMAQIEAHKDRDVIVFDITTSCSPAVRINVLRQVVTTFDASMNIYALIYEEKWGMKLYLYKKIGPAIGSVEGNRFAMEFKGVTNTKFDSKGQIKINVIESFLQ